MELLQLLRPFRRQQVRPAGEDLAELDEGRPQGLDRAAHALRLGQAGHVNVGPAALGEPRQMAEAEALHDLGDTESDQDSGDLAQALPVASGDEGGFQHVRKGLPRLA